MFLDSFWSGFPRHKGFFMTMTQDGVIGQITEATSLDLANSTPKSTLYLKAPSTTNVTWDLCSKSFAYTNIDLMVL